MKHEPIFNTFITPCCPVLKFRIIPAQRSCPFYNSVEISCREAVLVVDTPDLPFCDPVFLYVSFRLMDNTHGFRTTWFDSDQNKIPVDRIILDEPFESVQYCGSVCSPSQNM